MLKILLKIGVFLILSTGFIRAQSTNLDLMGIAKETPDKYIAQPDALVRYLKEKTSNPKELATLIAYWVLQNIDYDLEAFLAGKMPKRTWKQTLQEQKAICLGYSELYQVLCKKAGIENHIIKGFAKGYGYKAKSNFKQINHAWNVLHLDGQYHLVDLTWASGTVYRMDDGSIQFKAQIKQKEIFADPDYFIQRRMPNQPRWQLLEHPVSMELFQQTSDQVNLNLVDRSQSYQFQDSIQLYLTLGTQNRLLKDAEDAYRFYPLDQAYALQYYRVAYQYSRGKYSNANMKKAVRYFEIARSKYVYALQDHTRAARCDKGIAYAKYRLQKRR